MTYDGLTLPDWQEMTSVTPISRMNVRSGPAGCLGPHTLAQNPVVRESAEKKGLSDKTEQPFVATMGSQQSRWGMGRADGGEPRTSFACHGFHRTTRCHGTSIHAQNYRDLPDESTSPYQ